MEQLAKQNNNIEQQAKAVAVSSNCKYRALIFKVLESLQFATLEIIERDQHSVFGDREADLKGRIVIHDATFFRDVVIDGSIGASEAYIDGKWTSPDLTKVIQIMARNQSQLDELDDKTQWISRIKNLLLRRKNANTEQGSKRNILAHYDIGNELYERFLDSSMQYSSAIYSGEAETLSKAQQNKMKTICERLELSEKDSVVEIGTGWGGLAIFMAQHYGCHVTTTTISDAQHALAEQRVKALGLTDKITLLKEDYRNLTGEYDKLVSIEMIEAVGHEYLQTFFEKCSSLLKPSGKMLIQAITIADSRYDKYRKGVDFIQKYIFPGGCLPSVSVMTQHLATSTDLVVQEIDDIGLHYARTLNDWNIAFENSWEELESLGYSEEFKRLWIFYFCYCEGAFKERVISTHHLVARKPRYFGAKDETVLDY
ncbi:MULTISPECIES: cyclopropane-fatty-acyl-phospholipid synthase family protein [Vibrio]|uniref:SAM-dependent methyltransferase n=1 Tax=Vibrio TaxID=662 RepID=UPI00030755D5|nr:cyclopropane-fatty-acyl-phospholipid synthase family protein [Vibrio tasmaniensis]OEF71108.1 cyclopropane-fatty-acyl-phospholipid synthase [Vibrio tasmaniensis 1F-155]PMO78171.1 cyclopropane-fatty-acyl-phospholipid synthase [Vibrio tasmaniensis]